MKSLAIELPSIAISLKQPWATLIVCADKDVENRSWKTRFRGNVLIHASKKRDEKEMRSFMDLKKHHNFEPSWKHGEPLEWQDMPCGGIVGMVEIVDCVTESESPWFVGEYGFVLRNARPLPFFPCRGSLSFWKCNYPRELLTGGQI